MPKFEKGTPQQISKNMKLKGLQKLRWYCEMCKKQCRDQNAFKQHCLTETHQRQIRLFAENPGQFISDYSKQFEHNFLDLMRRKYFSGRVKANSVYVDYISDKEHVHMNATRFTTLSAFCEHLAEKGKITLEKTPKALYIQYIDNSNEAIARKMAEEKKIQIELKDHKRNKDFLERQLEHAQISQKNQEGDQRNTSEKQQEDLEDIEGHSKIEINFKSINQKNKIQTNSVFQQPIQNKNQQDLSYVYQKLQSQKSSENKKKHISTVDFLMKEIQTERQKKLHLENNPKNEMPQKINNQIDEFEWISEGIIVKIKDKNLKDHYKKKGTIVKIEEKYQADVKIQETNKIIRIDQSLLETVIPKIEGLVLVLKNGVHYKKVGILESVNTDTKTCIIKLLNENLELELTYKEFSKIEENYKFN